MTSKATPRRSQEERSHSTRKRILDAAMHCLKEDGYAGTTVSRVIEQAGVSRGAYLHHYPNKSDLLRDTAERLMAEAYQKLSHATRESVHGDDRLVAMLEATWNEVFADATQEVFLQLCAGARADDTLAEVFHPLAIRYVTTLQQAARHYFTTEDGTDPGDLIILTQWLFRGMAMDMPLASKPEHFDRFVSLWGRVVGEWLIPKRDVDGPPPPPAFRRRLDDENDG